MLTLVSAAEVDSEGNAVESPDQSIVGPERAPEIGEQILPARPHRLDRRAVDIGGVSRSVDMDVAASRLYEASDHRAFDLDHVGKEILHGRINRRRIRKIDALRDSVRADQADLHRFARKPRPRSCTPRAPGCT
jgi:hypothetical protein